MTDWITDLLNAIDAKDADGFVSFMTDDVRFRYGSQETVEGKAAVRAAAEHIFTMFAELSHHIGQAWTVDDVVFCEGEVTYTRVDGFVVTLPFLNVFRMTGSAIADYRIYIDPSPLAAG